MRCSGAELLKPYAVRFAGESVLQGGDPVPRSVFHCTLRQPVALLMVGASNVGKTSLAFDLGERNIPLMHTDRLLGSILHDKRYNWSPVAEVARKVPARTPVNFSEIGRAVAARCAKDFVDIIMREGPLEADLFCIEGEILRHDAIRDELLRRLHEQGIRPWLLTPEVVGLGARDRPAPRRAAAGACRSVPAAPARAVVREARLPEGSMQGYVDQVTTTKASGWVFDPDNRSREVQVRLRLDDKVVAEATANQPRPGVGRLLGTDGRHGFQLPGLALAAEEPRPGGDRGPGGRRPVAAGRAARHHPPQAGGAVSDLRRRQGRLEVGREAQALQLGRLRNRHSERAPLKGLSVLDLGCNEGFFCGEALRQGARRVVGIDRSGQSIERAKKRFPDASLHPRLVVGRAGRAVRRDPVPVGDPLRAAAARAAAEARRPPDAHRDAGPRMRDGRRPPPRPGTRCGGPTASGATRSYLMLRQELLKPYAVRHAARASGRPATRSAASSITAA